MMSKSIIPLYRRAQLEMVGLVLIVAIVMIGIILYVVSLSKQDSGQENRDLLQEQKGSAFLTAILDTSVPQCSNVTVSIAIQKCAEDKPFCDSGNACRDLEIFLKDVTNMSLYEQGSKFNLTLKDSLADKFSIVKDCNTGAAKLNRSIRVLAAPQQDITLSDTTKAKLILAICK